MRQSDDEQLARDARAEQLRERDREREPPDPRGQRRDPSARNALYVAIMPLACPRCGEPLGAASASERECTTCAKCDAPLADVEEEAAE